MYEFVGIMLGVSTTYLQQIIIVRISRIYVMYLSNKFETNYKCYNCLDFCHVFQKHLFATNLNLSSLF